MAGDMADIAGLFAMASGAVDSPNAPRGDIGFHQGLILAWDASTGSNSVFVAGSELTDLPVLTTADSVMLTAGDAVGILRFKSTYFILGRVAPVGGGAQLQIRSAEIATPQATTSLIYTNLATAGPTITNAYIGSARRCLVLVSCFIQPASADGGQASFDVTGASTIFAEDVTGCTVSSNIAGALRIQTTGFELLTAADGLNEGLNTFQMKYHSDNGGSCNFSSRKIVVFPF